MPPVLVSWDWHGDETVHILSETHQTVLGGPEHDIDLGDGSAAQAWLVDGPAGWLLGKHEDGSETPLAHGDRFAVRRHRFQFLFADDVARALDEDRYLRTVMDPLTNVFNRRFFYIHTRRAAPAALLMLDLDRFMSFNDQHGHLAGDVALQQLAARLRDSLTWPELIVRYGGEEFLVILPGASLATALERAETLRQLADEPLDIEGEAPVVTISIGVALIGTGDDALNDALRAADANLMYAKERGRNRVVG
jgi:two-component system cell cycle response regulator